MEIKNGIYLKVFLATVNFDHTTEELSSRFLNRSWVIVLEPGQIDEDSFITESVDNAERVISYRDFINAFGEQPKESDELDDKIVTLALTLEPDDGLTLAYTDRVHVRILITNQLIRPSYWDMPLSLYFGPYSKAKHQKCIEIMGHDFPLKEEDLMDYNGVSGYSYWMRAGRQVCNYYATHTEYDENGDLIAPWDPF